MGLALLNGERKRPSNGPKNPSVASSLRRIAASVALLVAAVPLFSSAALVADVSPNVELVTKLIERGEHERALERARAVLADKERDAVPDDKSEPIDGKAARLWFEKARALTQLERLDDAATALERAVQVGYRNFTRMRTDSALVPLRTHEAFKAIDKAARQAEPNRARNAYEQWIEQFGNEEYHYAIDESRQLLYATALDDIAQDEMRKMIEELADHLEATLFDHLPEYEVLIAVPTPADAREVLPRGSVGGLYEHRYRRLIARDIGPAMRHEFFHVMHYGHMERIGQIHPLWVQEGLATLYEDYDIDHTGAIRFVPNERHTIARQNLRSGQVIPWRDLFSYSADRFMARSAASYPQARSIFEFVADRGKLETWYHTYVDTFHDDPTGATAFEQAFNMPLNRIEREWQRWLRQRPNVPMHLEPGDASLGVETRPNTSSVGVLITHILQNSAAERGGMEIGDVIVAVNGRPTRTIEELRRVISSHHVGERVRVRVRRDDRHKTITVELRPLRM